MKHFRTQVTLRVQSLLLLAVLSCIISASLRAQSTYPVQVNVYLPPPHGTYLSDYYTGTREKMVVSLLNRDMQRPSLEVFLRVTVSSASGFQVRSRLEGSYPPVTLDAGVPVRLTQDDLAPYFLPRNTTASGGSPGGQLPEGLVEFTVEAFERYTGKALSLGATARIWLSRQKPPLPRLPSNGDNLPFREPMQLKFQWEPQHRNLSQVEYEFELRELPGNGVAPQSAFAYAPVVHGERLACTYLAYNTATMYPLSPGKTYGWRVRAVARDGVDEVNAFDNGGYSQTCWFSTSTACDPPEGLQASLDGRSLDLSWTAPADTGRYLVQLREKDAPSPEWQSATTPGTHYTARGLNRGSAYEYRVGRVCAVGGPVFTGVGEVAVPEVDSARMAHCGVPGKYDRSNKEPLKELRVGDVVIVGGDYPMTVTKVTASLGNGMFAGEGWIQMKWLFDSKLAVEFSDLVINADKIQIGGVARAKQRKDESQIANLDRVAEGGTDNTRSGVIVPDYTLDVSIPANATFSYDPETGRMTVYTTDGQQVATLTLKNRGRDVFPVTVKDKDGKVVQVDTEKNPDGSVKTGADGRPVLTSATVYPIPERGFNPKLLTTGSRVEFEQGGGAYSLDNWPEAYLGITLFRDMYGRMALDYRVPWKFLPAGGRDVVTAVFTPGKGDRMSPDSIVFSTPQGLRLSKRRLSDNRYEVTLVAGQEKDVQEVYALYPVEGSSSRFETLGKLEVVTYATRQQRLVLVPVNGAAVDGDAVEKYLNKVYNPVGVGWTVDRADNFAYADTTAFLAKGSGLLSAYTPAMRRLNAAYKSERGFEAGTAYLFVIADSGGGRDRDVAGFMPRGGQKGYLFLNSLGSYSLAEVAAHELGHGCWRLRHTFADNYGNALKRGSTDNLMDYKPGNTALAKWQWDQIVSPAWITSPFEKDEEGEIAVEKYIKLDNDGVFFTPSGNPFLLKKGTKIYTACMDYSRFPKWAVYSFEADGKKYNTDFTDNLSAGITFNGYYQKDTPSNKYSLPSEVTGYATYAGLKELDGKHIQMLLWQEKVSRTHKNDGEYKIRDISIPENLAQVEGSNTLDASSCDYYRAILDASLVDSVKSADGKAVLKIYKDSESGKFTVEVELKGAPKNDAVKAQEAAVKTQMEALAGEKLNELGLSGSKSPAVKMQAEDGGEFYVKGMDGREWLTTIADLGQSVWENASLPENYWNKDKGYDKSTIHVPPTFAGVGDGVIDQVTQYPQLIKLGYDVATKSEVREGLWNAVKNISPSSVYSFAEKTVKERIEKYNFDDKYWEGWHQIGKDGVQVLTLATGGTIFTKANDAVENGVKATGEKFIKKISPELDRLWQLSKQKLGRFHSSKILGENLEATGKVRPPNSAAHHIVAGGANNQFAKDTRQLLEDAEIDINEAANGVFLPKNSKYVIDDAASHANVHTNAYYEAVYNRLKDLPKEDFRDELSKISQELLNGTFPY